MEASACISVDVSRSFPDLAAWSPSFINRRWRKSLRVNCVRIVTAEPINSIAS